MEYSELARYTYEQLGDLTYEQMSLPIGKRFVTNRTQADVERWKVLRSKGWDNMTEIERQEWMGQIDLTPSAVRGMYTHNDMNRVETAIEAILNRFKEMGYKVPELSIEKERTHSSKLLDSDVEEFFRKIAVVRGLLPVYPSTPIAPYPGERMDYKLANDIEQILLDVDEIFTKVTWSWHYAGDLFTGEV